jgi:hypothetical protein
MTRPDRRQGRRRIALVLAVVAMGAALAAPAAAAEPPVRHGGRPLPDRTPDRGTATLFVPDGSIGFLSYLGWVYSDDSIAIVGEVLNNETARRKSIDLKVTWFSSDQPGATALGSTTDSVLIDGVARGSVGPFVVYEPTPPAGTAAFQIEITSSTSTTAAMAGGLDLSFDASYVDDNGTPADTSDDLRYYPGTVHNPNTFPVTDPLVVLTAYNATGDVGEVMSDAPAGPIPAGGDAPFSIGIAADFGPNFTMSKVKFTADAFNANDTTKVVTSWDNYFDDLLGSTFRGDIVWLAEQDITRGCSPGKYCPNASVTRGQMASFLVRALGLPSTTTDFFTDDDGTTHEVDINRLRAANITTGCAPGLYCPADDVSRGQMASFLARAFDLPATATDYFTDDTGTTHEGNINRIAAAGITTGCTATTYCPKADVTRGQMAAFLRRALSD